MRRPPAAGAVLALLVAVAAAAAPTQPTIAEIESQLRGLQAEMGEMQRRMAVLQAQLAAMQERQAEPPASAPATRDGPPPAPATLPAPTAASAATPPRPAIDSKFPLRFYGKVKLDAIYDSNDLGASEFITYVPLAADGERQVSFTGRETQLGIASGGPRLGDWVTSARFESDFYGSAPSSGSGSLRIRLAYVDASDGQTSIRAGQDWLPTATLNPSTANFTIMAYNGNLWGRVPQVTLRRTFSDRAGGFVSAFRCRSEEDVEHDLGCDLAMPWVAAGVRFQADPFGTGEMASLAFSGAIRNGKVQGASVTPRLASAEFLLPWRALSLRGEAYLGEGIGAEFLHRGGAFNRAGKPIRTAGGFVQLGVRAAEPVRLHVGYGFDDPNDGDLVADEFHRRSTCLFGNAFYDLSPELSLVLEGTRIRTTWSDGPKDGYRLQSAVIFLW